MSGELTTSLPKGGIPGQVLTKVSYDNYKVDWKDPPGGGGGGGGTSSGWILPTGCIVLWSGSESNVPDGFALCNGQNGTPDLRDRFVLGAGNKYAVGEMGGSEEVTLTVEQMPKHSHEYILSMHAGTSGGLACMGTVKYDDYSTGSSGSSKPHPNMPPYYTLAYIMKI